MPVSLTVPEKESVIRFSNAPDAPQHARNSYRIRQEIMAEGDRLRARYPLLQRRYQDRIAVAIMAVCLLGMAFMTYAYITWQLSAWVVVPVVAILASLIHELEHDLLHWMYFRDKPWAHHLMLFLGFLVRPNTVLPWIRRQVHIIHHQNSGTEEDLEEYAITNGERWNLLRLLMLADLPFTILVHNLKKKGLREKLSHLGLVAVVLFPLGMMTWLLWYVFLGFHAINYVAAPQWSTDTLATMHTINILVAVLIGPNMLRTFCLNFMSSNLHYHGDVERGNLIQETQVFNAWWFLPFNLFSFNVGGTHGIHHFVVREPFWVRQLTAKRAHEVMAQYGVRFNDMQTFLRANRWSKLETVTTAPLSSGA